MRKGAAELWRSLKKKVGCFFLCCSTAPIYLFQQFVPVDSVAQYKIFQWNNRNSSGTSDFELCHQLAIRGSTIDFSFFFFTVNIKTYLSRLCNPKPLI